jgi:peptidoglycan hydrolase-like protein with peptidoglycan-binding domain
MSLHTLHKGGQGDSIRALQAATNRRLNARDLDQFKVKEDGYLGTGTLKGVRKAAWALGALSTTYEAITDKGRVPVGVQQMIRNPGRRTPEQLARADARISQLRADRKRRAKQREEERKRNGLRNKIVNEAQQAAANYRKNPGAYHYLAGGVANLIFLHPTPRNYRSDCSQFVASCYYAAGAPSPAIVPHKYASTYSMDAMVDQGKATITTKPRPADLGMYGPRHATHHVELYCAEPGQEFIGHGSPPIDSLTPGRPDFYITFPFLG